MKIHHSICLKYLVIIYGLNLPVAHIISLAILIFFFFFSSRRRHTRLVSDWSSDVCSSDLAADQHALAEYLAGKRHLPRIRQRLRQEDQRYDRRRPAHRGAARGRGGAGVRDRKSVV